MKLERAVERVFDRCNLSTGDCDIYHYLYQYKAIRELPDDEIEKLYDCIADRLGFTRG